MDMKKILQALDGASEKPVEGSNDMKKFLQIVEGRNPSNRLTQAESIAVNHYVNITEKKDIAVPVLNVAKESSVGLIGKYFKTVEQELNESAEKKLMAASKLAERVASKINKK
jgi:hypothetical protein